MAVECTADYEPAAAELAVLAAFLADLRDGLEPDVEEFLRRAPKYRASLRRVLEAAAMVHGAYARVRLRRGAEETLRLMGIGR